VTTRGDGDKERAARNLAPMAETAITGARGAGRAAWRRISSGPSSTGMTRSVIHRLRAQLADEIEAVEPVARDRDLPTSERLPACAPSCATRRVDLRCPRCSHGLRTAYPGLEVETRAAARGLGVKIRHDCSPAN